LAAPTERATPIEAIRYSVHCERGLIRRFYILEDASDG
jgi:hypothetical protein